ncbi:MAG TPA: hypothetical protein VJ854_05230 [Sphaerochaeta sp.]|nr:hypothetical protein [Sphaerochaeta sp.]
MQIYLLSIAYLLVGAALLLSDAYGGRFALLLSLRYLFRTKRVFRVFLIIAGLVLCLALGCFPVAPGPRLLGDFIPLANTVFLTFWYISHALRHIEQDEKPEEQSLLKATGQYFEKNKRNFGFITLVIAVLHFLVPTSVLL